MSNKKEIPLLTSEDIEVKIKQVTKAGALALLYKTARVDRKILNTVFGPLNWTSDYKVVKDNLYCGIGIRENVDQEFVWKWDCGIESRGDDEGNEKKGEASDAFKRAGFQVGIGEELYTAPFIWLSVETVQEGGKWKLKDPFAKYVVTHIAYNNETRVITELDICNAKSNILVYKYRIPTTGAVAKKMSDTLGSDINKNKDIVENASIKKSVSKSTASTEDSNSQAVTGKTNVEPNKPTLNQLISEIGHMVKNMYAQEGSPDNYTKIIKEITGDDTFKCNKATDEEYDTVLAIYNALLTGGYNGK